MIPLNTVLHCTLVVTADLDKPREVKLKGALDLVTVNTPPIMPCTVHRL